MASINIIYGSGGREGVDQCCPAQAKEYNRAGATCSCWGARKNAVTCTSHAPQIEVAQSLSDSTGQGFVDSPSPKRQVMASEGDPASTIPLR